MDLQLYGRTLWRHRLILLTGISLALALALLAVVRVEFRDGRPSFYYRQPEIWQAITRLHLTQRGFPEGRSRSSADVDSSVSDAGRMSSLASYYAELASTDAVQLEVLGGTTEVASMAAFPVLDLNTKNPLPFIDVYGYGESPLAAARIADRGAAVFVRHVSERQSAARIPTDERVVLQVVKRPLGVHGPELAEGRKKTTLVFVFLAVLTATFGFIFVVENLRSPRGPTPVRVEPAQEVPPPVHEQRSVASRRS